LRIKEILVRKATEKDMEGIVKVLESAKLEQETWKGNVKWAKKALQSSLSDKNYVVLLAECNSSIDGFITCMFFPSFWEGGKQGMIIDLFVRHIGQNKGVGSKLLIAITELAKVEGIAEMHVSTENINEKARKLYERYGFTEQRLLLERHQTTK